MYYLQAAFSAKSSPLLVVLSAGNQHNDHELIQHYRESNDLKLVSEFMDRYCEPIIGMSFNYLKSQVEVQDFSQELFLKLRDKLLTSTIANPRAWLLTVVRNLLIDKLRAGQGRKEILMDQLTETGEWDEVEDLREKYLLTLEKSLADLSENERLCLEGIYLNGKSYAEIMQASGLSFNQIRGYRDRAIVKLKLRITEKLST